MIASQIRIRISQSREKLNLARIASFEMSSNQDISSLLGDFSKTFSELVNRLQPTPGTTANNARAFESARNALRSLQSDSRMANDVSLTFNRSVSAENSSSSSRPTLPSVARRQAASHRFSPYNGKGRKKTLREPKRYDMKLLVVDHIPELFSAPARSISTYRGEAVIETAFFLMEDETANSVFDKIMDVIKGQYPDYEGQFFFTTRRNRNQLTIVANQDLDARGVRTLKGTGSVYVVLDAPVGHDDEVCNS